MLLPNLNCAFSILIISTTPIWGAIEENILKTEVFEIVLSPSMFNWTYEGNPNQYVYQPSLLDAPDLPSWISYVFSERHHSGFLYGVPPVNLDSSTIQLSIVALNRKTYDTRHEVLTIHISEKLNPARYEVHMKIDNLNVEDMFDVERMERLKDIYRKNLWKDSQNDLYVTFLASAIKLGARRPLNPNEGEGSYKMVETIDPSWSEVCPNVCVSLPTFAVARPFIQLTENLVYSLPKIKMNSMGILETGRATESVE